jgi:acetolactate synthase-1/2/3 large subunit
LSAARERSGGQAIVDGLLAHGVDTVFGIPGVQTYGLFDAFAGAGLRVVAPRHEQATAYMAFGYARATGRPGVCSVVPGVGFLNASAAIATAYGASAPVLCLTGEVPSRYIGSGLGHLHELPDQLATMRTITKWADRIDHPADAPRLVGEAFAQMRTGRPRPVALAMPWEVFDQRAPVAAAEPRAVSTPVAAPAELERAAELLGGARAPMILVGGGAQHASAEVLELAEHLQAPVVSFRSGRGIVSDEHPLGLTCVEGFELWDGTDVVVGIGSRIELQWFRWGAKPAGLRTVLIDIDPRQHARLRPAVPIVADAAQGTAALTEAVRAAAAAPRASRAAELSALKARVAERVQAIAPHAAYLRAIREVLPRDGFFVEEVCQTGFTSYFALPVYEPRTFVTCGPQGTLGFGLATALGVKIACPERAVVSINGDGGFAFGLQELITAAQYGIGVAAVVFDNGAYGNVLRDQHRLYDGREVASRLENPDFAAVARACGVRATRADTPDALRDALGAALERDEAEVIVVPVDRATEVSPWPLLMPRGG